MDPYWQTIVTVVCMLAAFFWGKSNGFKLGAVYALDLIMETIEADSFVIDLNDETVDFFKEGKHFSAKRAWTNDEKEES